MFTESDKNILPKKTRTKVKITRAKLIQFSIKIVPFITEDR